MKCSFTGEEIPPGTGIMYVKKDGKIIWFGSSKARKNMLGLGRKANKQLWTEEGRAAKKMKLASLKHEKADKKEAPTEKASDAKQKKSAPQKASKAPAKKEA